MVLRISLKRVDRSESPRTHQMTNTPAAKAAMTASTPAQPHTATPVPAAAVVASAPPSLFTTTTPILLPSKMSTWRGQRTEQRSPPASFLNIAC